MKDVYADYAKKVLAENPEWFSKYDAKHNISHGLIYAREKGRQVLKISWVLWKDVVSGYFHRGKNAIIKGETLRIGAGVGKIRGCRVERNMRKKVVDWPATMRANRRDENGKLIKILYTTEDYCRIEWVKFNLLQNEKAYNFDPASKNTTTGKGFKGEFSQALKNDPFLKYRFVYYPLHVKVNKRCNTSTPA
jgi:hypothetical protein